MKSYIDGKIIESPRIGDSVEIMHNIGTPDNPSYALVLSDNYPISWADTYTPLTEVSQDDYSVGFSNIDIGIFKEIVTNEAIPFSVFCEDNFVATTDRSLRKEVEINFDNNDFESARVFYERIEDGLSSHFGSYSVNGTSTNIYSNSWSYKVKIRIIKVSYIRKKTGNPNAIPTLTIREQ